jgi:hypothetical protein
MKPHARFYHILESIQYGILYLLAAFAGGVSLDFSFPHFDDAKPTGVIFYEASFQCILLVLVVYLVRFIVKGVPILFPIAKGSGYIPYRTAEFNGEMMMGFVFLGSQLNLIRKIDELASRLYVWLFTEERKGKDGAKQEVEKVKAKL